MLKKKETDLYNTIDIIQNNTFIAHLNSLEKINVQAHLRVISEGDFQKIHFTANVPASQIIIKKVSGPLTLYNFNQSGTVETHKDV